MIRGYSVSEKTVSRRLTRRAAWLVLIPIALVVVFSLAGWTLRPNKDYLTAVVIDEAATQCTPETVIEAVMASDAPMQVLPAAVSEMAPSSSQSTASVPTPLPVMNTELPKMMPAANPPTRIVAPAINLDEKIVPVGWQLVSKNGQTTTIWDVAQYAVGWHKNSKLPGQGGNIVLAGHNNVYGEVFRRLEDLKPGDVVTIYADGRAYEYEVTFSFTVQEEGVSLEQQRANARWIGPSCDEKLTLLACWPYTGSSHRIFVIAKPKFQV